MAAFILPALAACGEDPDPRASPEPGLTPSEFVEVITEVRKAEREVGGRDSAEVLFAERKAEILARHDTDDAEVRAFVASYRNDVVALEVLWDSIDQRLKYAPMPTGGDTLETSPAPRVGRPIRGRSSTLPLGNSREDTGRTTIPPPHSPRPDTFPGGLDGRFQTPRGGGG